MITMITKIRIAVKITEKKEQQQQWQQHGHTSGFQDRNNK